jgi:hypothetical protein
MSVAAFLLICAVVFVLAVAISFHTAKNGPQPGPPEHREKLLALEFLGVVVETTRIAHAFDAGYGCKVTIKCDDGRTVTMTTAASDERLFPVGARVVKRVGRLMPEPTADTTGPDT